MHQFKIFNKVMMILRRMENSWFCKLMLQLTIETNTDVGVQNHLYARIYLQEEYSAQYNGPRIRGDILHHDIQHFCISCIWPGLHIMHMAKHATWIKSGNTIPSTSKLRICPNCHGARTVQTTTSDALNVPVGVLIPSRTPNKGNTTSWSPGSRSSGRSESRRPSCGYYSLPSVFGQAHNKDRKRGKADTKFMFGLYAWLPKGPELPWDGEPNNREIKTFLISNYYKHAKYAEYAEYVQNMH